MDRPPSTPQQVRRASTRFIESARRTNNNNRSSICSVSSTASARTPNRRTPAKYSTWSAKQFKNVMPRVDSSSSLSRPSLCSTMSSIDGNMGSVSVGVMVRVRPFLQGENENSCVDVIGDDKTATIQIADQQFTYDSVFRQEETQENVFIAAGKPIATNALQGFNGSVFAYGQTGSGKTHTMQGGKDEQRGLIPRVLEHCFAGLGEMREKGAKTVTSCSYVEIYNELVYDLLEVPSKEKSRDMGYMIKDKKIRENATDGVFVDGLIHRPVHNMEEALMVIAQGSSQRHVASTQMNHESSRSHSIFTLSLEIRSPAEDGSALEVIRTAKINLIDLAGSERQCATGAVGERLNEAKHINKSLSALGLVISALVDIGQGKQRLHIPHRDSALTYLLRDSLGGNTKTSIICTVSPDPINFQDTLSTLKFGQRAKYIKNAVRENTTTSTDVTALQNEVRRLKEELSRVRKSMISPLASPTEQQRAPQEPEVSPIYNDEGFLKAEKKVLSSANAPKSKDGETQGETVLRGRITHLERVLSELLLQASEEREIANKLRVENQQRKDLEEVLKDTIAANDLVQQMTQDRFNAMEQGSDIGGERMKLYIQGVETCNELKLRAEIAQLKSENASLATLYKEKRDPESLSRRINAQQVYLEAIQDDKAELERLVKDLSENNKKLLADNSQLEKSVEAAHRSVALDTLEAVRTEKEALDGELKAALMKIERLEHEFFVATEKYSSRPSVSLDDRQGTLLADDESNVNASIASKADQLVRQRLVMNLRDTKKRLSLAENQNKRLSVQLERRTDSARKERRSMRQSLTVEKNNIDHEQVKVVQLQLQLDSTQEKYERVLLNNQTLKETVESANTTLAMTRKQLEFVQAEKDALVERLRQESTRTPTKENCPPNHRTPPVHDSRVKKAAASPPNPPIERPQSGMDTKSTDSSSQADGPSSSSATTLARKSISVAEFFPSETSDKATQEARLRAQTEIESEMENRRRERSSISSTGGHKLSTSSSALPIRKYRFMTLRK